MVTLDNDANNAEFEDKEELTTTENIKESNSLFDDSSSVTLDGVVIQPTKGTAYEGDEGINNALRINSKITITLQKIKVADIVTSKFKQLSRDKTLIGLSGVIGEWGVVNPVQVMELEDDAYMIFDGLRRVFGAVRAGETEIIAMVWKFEDKQEGKEKANLISLMINRSQKYRASELWEQMKILEEVNGASPGLIEFLLQMRPGQAMKLKDVMLSDDEYYEIREDLIEGVTDIESAYKKLCNERRKENQLAKEDAMVIQGGASEDSEGVDDTQNLSVDAVKDLLDLHSSVDIDNETIDSLNRSDEAREGEYVQDPKNRHPLDPALKQQVLIRDDFTCQCCGLGGEAYLATLAVHHIVEVSQGGPDSDENLVTVCVNCHLLIHSYSWGKIYVDLTKLEEDEKEKFKKIFKYGNVIIEADKKLGKTKDTKKGKNPSLRHPFPGEGLKDNKMAYQASLNKKAEKAEETVEEPKETTSTTETVTKAEE